MSYTLRVKELSDTTLEFLIGYCISGLKYPYCSVRGKGEFFKFFAALLDEKLKRNEIS